MAQKRELINLTITNNSDCTLSIPLFQVGVASINATTKYAWELDFDYSCGFGSIIVNGTSYSLSYDGTLSGLLSALNALNFGLFCSETVGGDLYVYTIDDTNVYGVLDLCTVATTSTTTTTTTAATTTTTSTTTTTTTAATTTTSTTTTTTTEPVTTSTTTTTTTEPTTTSTTTTTTTEPVTTSTTTTTTTEPTTTSTTTTTTTEPVTTSTTTTTTTEPVTTSTTTTTTTEPVTTSTTTTTTTEPVTTSTTTTTTTAFSCPECLNWEYVGASIPEGGDIITYYRCSDGALQTIVLSFGDPTGNFCNCTVSGTPSAANGTTLTQIGICAETTTTTTSTTTSPP